MFAIMLRKRIAMRRVDLTLITFFDLDVALFFFCFTWFC